MSFYEREKEKTLIESIGKITNKLNRIHELETFSNKPKKNFSLLT